MSRLSKVASCQWKSPSALWLQPATYVLCGPVLALSLLQRYVTERGQNWTSYSSELFIWFFKKDGKISHLQTVLQQKLPTSKLCDNPDLMYYNLINRNTGRWLSRLKKPAFTMSLSSDYGIYFNIQNILWNREPSKTQFLIDPCKNGRH